MTTSTSGSAATPAAARLPGVDGCGAAAPPPAAAPSAAAAPALDATPAGSHPSSPLHQPAGPLPPEHDLAKETQPPGNAATALAAAKAAAAPADGPPPPSASPSEQSWQGCDGSGDEPGAAQGSGADEEGGCRRARCSLDWQAPVESAAAMPHSPVGAACTAAPPGTPTVGGNQCRAHLAATPPRPPWLRCRVPSPPSAPAGSDDELPGSSSDPLSHSDDDGDDDAHDHCQQQEADEHLDDAHWDSEDDYGDYEGKRAPGGAAALSGHGLSDLRGDGEHGPRLPGNPRPRRRTAPCAPLPLTHQAPLAAWSHHRGGICALQATTWTLMTMARARGPA
jgi:hypothetical protein